MSLIENELHAENRRGEAIQRLATITPREIEVLKLVSDGQTNKAIARLLDISPKTVELHRANLLKKTQTGSSIQLVKLAVLAGIAN